MPSLDVGLDGELGDTESAAGALGLPGDQPVHRGDDRPPGGIRLVLDRTVPRSGHVEGACEVGLPSSICALGDHPLIHVPGALLPGCADHPGSPVGSYTTARRVLGSTVNFRQGADPCQER
ncbi:hypothetical protein [Streptomyces sp. NPDC014733]|uniref:hypothetical protein n=1 Tax=Streptomyces sp. NPDC014733 TaxID=3364885 RepID=UPI0036F6EE5A